MEERKIPICAGNWDAYDASTGQRLNGDLSVDLRDRSLGTRGRVVPAYLSDNCWVWADPTVERPEVRMVYAR